jgi:hypothetical protein
MAADEQVKPADEGRRSSEGLGLVERLRLRTLVQHGGPKGMDYGWNLQEHDSELHRDAADEIERLLRLQREYEEWVICGEVEIEGARPGIDLALFRLGAWWADRPWRKREA